MAVPNTTNFNLINVKSEIESKSSATINSLSDAFTESKDEGFDAAYKGSKNNLYNFRNYTHPTEAIFELDFINYNSCNTYYVTVSDLTTTNTISITYERIDGNYSGNAYIRDSDDPAQHAEVVLATNSDSVTRSFNSNDYRGEISFTIPPTPQCGGIGWLSSEYIVLRFTLNSLSVNGVPSSNVFTHIVGNPPA